MNSITLDDIARDLGLSKATVSYVLSGRGRQRRIAEATIQRVTQHATSVGYTPNAVARSLSQRRTNLVGVVASGFQMDWLQGIYEGLEPVFDQAGVIPVFAVRGWCPERERAQLRRLAEQRVDVVMVLNPLEQNRELYRSMLSRSTPVVFVSDELEDMPEASSVAWDARPAVRRLVEHLTRSGRRRLAFAATRHAAVGTRQRFEAFESAVALCGARTRPDWIHWQHVLTTPPPGHLVEVEWIASIPWGTPEAPDAIVCLNDNVAFRVLRALLARGVQVPRQVAVTGLGNLPPAVGDLPGLTTAIEPLHEIGRRAAHMVLAFIQDPRRAPRRERVDTADLLVRRTTDEAAPPAWA